MEYEILDMFKEKIEEEDANKGIVFDQFMCSDGTWMTSYLKPKSFDKVLEILSHKDNLYRYFLAQDKSGIMVMYRGMK